MESRDRSPWFVNFGLPLGYAGGARLDHTDSPWGNEGRESLLAPADRESGRGKESASIGY